MIDLNPSSMVRSEAVAAIHALLDASMYRPEKRRDYLGASSIGAPCERRTQYEFMGAPWDEGWRWPPRLLRIFQRGHEFERMAAIWLADAGFRLTQTGKDGKPIGFRVADGDYAGHVDRVVTGGPLPEIAYPFVWECKGLGAKGWKKVSEKGVAKGAPQYADQISQYQSYLGLTNPALFFAINADTMEIHMEFVAFDKVRAQKASDRAVGIILDTRAGAMRPRCTNDPEFYECQGCQFRKRCWS